MVAVSPNRGTACLMNLQACGCNPFAVKGLVIMSVGTDLGKPRCKPWRESPVDASAVDFDRLLTQTIWIVDNKLYTSIIQSGLSNTTCALSHTDCHATSNNLQRVSKNDQN